MSKKFDIRLSPETALDRAIVRILKRECSDSLGAYISEVLDHGCRGGSVGAMLYYRDTCKFYRTYMDQILRIVQDTLDDIGAVSPSELFGDQWDGSDMFAREEQNQNLLAWYAFETRVRHMAREACQVFADNY